MRQRLPWKHWIAASCVLAATLMVAAGLAGQAAPGGHPAVPVLGETCTLFAVQDTAKGDSSLLRFDFFDPITGDPVNELTPLGICASCDIESLALHPETGILYGIAGGGVRAGSDLPAGELTIIDKSSGALTPIGNTGASRKQEIVAASFRSSDGSLWAFQSNVGLVTVDLLTASRLLQFSVAGVEDQFGNPVGNDWEGLAWDLEGEFLYGAQGTVLYRFDPVGGVVDLVCDNLAPAGGEVEALEFAFEGFLVGGGQLGGPPQLIQIGIPSEGEFGPGACSLTPIEIPPGMVAADDIESLAFEACPEDDDEQPDGDEDGDDEGNDEGNDGGGPNGWH